MNRLLHLVTTHCRNYSSLTISFFVSCVQEYPNFKNRIIVDPDNKGPDKWSSTVLHSAMHAQCQRRGRFYTHLTSVNVIEHNVSILYRNIFKRIIVV